MEENLNDANAQQKEIDLSKQETLPPEKKWNTLYKNYIDDNFKNWDEYFQTKMKLKRNFFKMIIKYLNTNKPILECGSGTGKFSAYLATLGFNVYAIDLEQEMVEQTKAICNHYSPNNPIHAIQCSAFDLPFEDKFFSVTHSSGVMEHYSDEEIVQLINEQLRVSNTCIFSVPTKYFEKKMLGNERFLSKKEWRKIIEKSNAKIIEKTGYHYKTLRNRIKDVLIKPKRLFKPIALFVFVLKEKEK